MAAIDYSNITPISLQKLEEKELRALYSGLRSILRKRLERQGKEAVYDIPAPTKAVAAEDLKMEVADIAAKLRDDSTRVSRKKGGKITVSPVTKSYKKLVKKFPELKRYQMKEFGRFMDMIRERMGERYILSVINEFSEMKRLGVTMNTIADKYKDFLENSRSLGLLVDAILATKAETGSVRSKDIDEILGIERDRNGKIKNKGEVL